MEMSKPGTSMRYGKNMTVKNVPESQNISMSLKKAVQIYDSFYPGPYDALGNNCKIYAA